MSFVFGQVLPALYSRDTAVMTGLLVAACSLVWLFYFLARRPGSRSLSDATAAFAVEIARLVKGERFLAQIILDERYASHLLRERDQQIRLGLKAARLGTWTWFLESGKVIGDAQLNVLYGGCLSDSSFDIEQCLARIDPEDSDRVREIIREASRGSADFHAEFRVVHADGSTHWIDARGVLLYDSAGQPSALTGVSIDIDAIKSAQLSLARSEQQFRDNSDILQESEHQFHQIADSMPQLVWVARPDGHVVWWNQQWYAYTGTTPEQTSGEGWTCSFHKDDRPWERWRESLQTGKPVDLEYRIRRHDGAYRWFLGRGSPVFDSDGNIVKWFGAYTDIEDYKQVAAQIRNINETLERSVHERTAELAASRVVLADTRSQLQAVVDSAARVAIIASDPAGVIMMFNRGAERMLQYRAEEVVGLCSSLLIHSETEILERAAMLTEKLNRPVSGLDVFQLPAQLGVFDESEWTYIRKDKTTLPVSLAVGAVRGADGAISGFLSIAIDISAQKSLERKLRENNTILAKQTKRAEEANVAKSAFLAAMSHEIRTPMNAILGMSDLLWESHLDAEQRQYVEVFRRAGNVLLDLINSVLDLSKIESGHLELEIHLFDLEDVVTRTLELLTPKAQAKGIQLLFQIAPNLQTKLMGDPVRLQQILVNLVGNAVKFTEFGEVLLRVQPHLPDGGRGIDISVSDTGIGIPPEQLNNIFDDFTQADASTTRKYGGTGLGLGISKRLIASMGGDLQVTSKPGVGSVFSFTIALTPGVERRLAPRAEIKDLVGVRILVIDNNETNRLILRETLMSWGLTSQECAGADEGCAEILRGLRESKPYDLVLMDRQMPLIDGFAAIPLLRLSDPRIPIVMLTSDNRAGDFAKRTYYRLAGYAVRPVKRADLLQLICAALATPDQPGPAAPNPLLLDGSSPRLPDGAGLRILIAEDSPDNRLLLQAYLDKAGHSLTFADNGERALQRFQRDSFDLVLMDVQMPVMDGLTASRAIRAYELASRRNPVPIIAITANALAHDAEASYQAGCNAHLSKPISKPNLLSAVEQYGAPRDAVSQPSPIWIDAPAGLEEFVPEYLESRQQEYPRLLESLASADFDSIRKKAHDLKGAGTSFGFLEISRIGAELEAAAKAADAEAVTRQLHHLGAYLNRVRIAPATTRVS